MNVLSLFDGMSCGRIALDRANIKVDKYYASELDKYAIKVSQANYPDIEHLGDVTNWRQWDIDWNIDLLIGGSPCQGFSFAGKQLAFDDPRSALFFVYVDILNHIKSINPNVKFMLENVRMKKEFLAIITEQVGVEPIFINSALVSAQNRQRYYWCNWDVEQPEDKGVLLKDIILSESDVHESMMHTNKAINYMSQGNEKWTQAGSCRADRYTQSVDKDKAFTLTANFYKGVPYNYFKCQERPCEPKVLMYQKGRGNNPGGIRAKDGKAPCLSANSWEHNNFITKSRRQQVLCGAMRGRYIVDGKRADNKVDSMAGKTEQRIEIRDDEKTNCLTTVQKDNLVIKSVNDNKRVKVITENDRGYRPHRGDVKSTGISELGRIMKHNSTTDALTTSHQPKLALNDDIKNLQYRKLTPIECERLQTVPDNYTNHVSNTQRYKMLGNGWTVDVIAHLFKNITCN